MKVYTYYLRGSQVNGQYSCRPEYLKFKIMKYAWLVRVWRFQLVLSINNTRKGKKKLI